ncbi:MAG TPA: hypothetical protein VJ943_04245 [Desulfotignum sp.]|nr:hypothetical protein [Desulfotignum sp.]
MDKKKRAAAMAAVYAHIKTSEERKVQALAEQAEQKDAAGAGSSKGRDFLGLVPNIWGMAGRQSQMQANTMMQLRMFR